MRTSALTLIMGFLLGFMFNAVIYLIPEYINLKSLVPSPAKGHYMEQISQLSSSLINSLTPNLLQPSSTQLRILCWIMTHPGNHYKKVIYIISCTVTLMYWNLNTEHSFPECGFEGLK